METTTPLTPISAKNVGEPATCDKCGKPFKNQMALRMHNLRKHTPGRGWNSAGNLKKQPLKWSRARRIKFNKTVAAKRNGSVATVQPQSIDSMGDAARAVMVAAQVLRAVSIGIKL